MLYVCSVIKTKTKMALKLDQQIHHIIVQHCGGNAKNVKGVNEGTLTKMSKGNSNLTVKTITNILKENGMSGEITVYGSGAKTTINFFQ